MTMPIWVAVAIVVLVLGVTWWRIVRARRNTPRVAYIESRRSRL